MAYLHFGESQRVVAVLPIVPDHTVIVLAFQIDTVQVGVVAVAVPPGAFVPHRTRQVIRLTGLVALVVVLVSRAEAVAEMDSQ